VATISALIAAPGTRRAKTFCPTGKSPGQFIDPSVQPFLQKYSGFPKIQITFIISPSFPTEGRLEIVTDAGQDAVDADVPLTNGA
jgi:hypothetical protein